MYNSILVAIALDHSRDNAKAFDVARLLANDSGKITAINVLEEIPAYVASQIPEDLLERRVAESKVELIAELGDASVMEVVVVRGHAGRTIVNYASDENVDCIVISSHRPGMQDYFLGSTAQRVVRHATCAVHIIR